MEKSEVKEILNARGMIYKGDFLESLSEEEFNKGMIKFNIPDEENIYSLNGEGVWGWISEEDKNLYNDDSYTGNIKAILCNSPLNYMGILFWGTELELVCRGSDRPTVSPHWVEDNIINAEWYNKED